MSKIDCTISKLRALFPELTGKRCSSLCCALLRTYVHCGCTRAEVWDPIARAPLVGRGGGGETAHPVSQISPKLKQITTRNLPYLSGQQFHTMCQKICARPYRLVTSKRRHVPPISTKNKGLWEMGITATGAVLKLRSIGFNN